jgi:hypothetical protein
MAFREPALLHAIIFCADSYCALQVGNREQPDALMHLGQAVRLVNQQLLEPVPRITDATIVVVCTFATAEVVFSNLLR